jgi:hypothetical protein
MIIILTGLGSTKVHFASAVFAFSHFPILSVDPVQSASDTHAGKEAHAG